MVKWVITYILEDGGGPHTFDVEDKNIIDAILQSGLDPNNVISVFPESQVANCQKIPFDPKRAKPAVYDSFNGTKETYNQWCRSKGIPFSSGPIDMQRQAKDNLALVTALMTQITLIVQWAEDQFKDM